MTARQDAQRQIAYTIELADSEDSEDTPKMVIFGRTYIDTTGKTRFAEYWSAGPATQGYRDLTWLVRDQQFVLVGQLRGSAADSPYHQVQ